MKKIISTALAASMLLAMTSTVFAVDATDLMVDETSKLYVKQGSYAYEVSGDVTIEPGDSFFVEILPEVAGEEITSSTAGKHKVVVDFDNGEDVIDEYEIVSKKIYNTTGAVDYKYLAEIQTKDSFDTDLTDIIGEVKVVKKSSGNTSDAPAKTIVGTVGFDSVTLSDDVHEVDNSAPVVNFDDMDEEVELLFGGNVSFTVDVDNQDELYLGFTEEPNTDIIDQNFDANIDFMSFDANPSFNRLGTMRFFTDDEDMFIYEIAANGALTEVEATYDEDYGAYAFKTRALSAYAISDIELSSEASSEETVTPETPVTPETETAKPNPGTGR